MGKQTIKKIVGFSLLIFFTISVMAVTVSLAAPPNDNGTVSTATGGGAPTTGGGAPTTGGDIGTGKPGGDVGTGKPGGDVGTGKPGGDIGTGKPGGDVGTGKPGGDIGTGKPGKLKCYTVCKRSFGTHRVCKWFYPRHHRPYRQCFWVPNCRTICR